MSSKIKQEVAEIYMDAAASGTGEFIVTPTKQQRAQCLWALAEHDSEFPERLIIVVATLSAQRDKAIEDFKLFMGVEYSLHPESGRFIVIKIPFGHLVDSAQDLPVVASEGMA